ncbi:hypothetical protein MFIFM68171_03930 [Madurella fahalii]|uniref:Uncharacterized protein n=1 Tax=Madurella fahalii TaxID=1157608 RepID=A0ABQ0G7N1_9PEZI
MAGLGLPNGDDDRRALHNLPGPGLSRTVDHHTVVRVPIRDPDRPGRFPLRFWLCWRLVFDQLRDSYGVRLLWDVQWPESYRRDNVEYSSPEFHLELEHQLADNRVGQFGREDESSVSSMVGGGHDIM